MNRSKSFLLHKIRLYIILYNIKTRWLSFFVVESVFRMFVIIFRFFHSLLPNGQLRKGRQYQVYNDRNEPPPDVENQGELESTVVTIIVTSVKYFECEISRVYL